MNTTIANLVCKLHTWGYAGKRNKVNSLPPPPPPKKKILNGCNFF